MEGEASPPPVVDVPDCLESPVVPFFTIKLKQAQSIVGTQDIRLYRLLPQVTEAEFPAVDSSTGNRVLLQTDHHILGWACNLDPLFVVHVGYREGEDVPQEGGSRLEHHACALVVGVRADRMVTQLEETGTFCKEPNLVALIHRFRTFVEWPFTDPGLLRIEQEQLSPHVCRRRRSPLPARESELKDALDWMSLSRRGAFHGGCFHLPRGWYFDTSALLFTKTPRASCAAGSGGCSMAAGGFMVGVARSLRVELVCRFVLKEVMQTTARQQQKRRRALLSEPSHFLVKDGMRVDAGCLLFRPASNRSMVMVVTRDVPLWESRFRERIGAARRSRRTGAGGARLIALREREDLSRLTMRDLLDGRREDEAAHGQGHEQGHEQAHEDEGVVVIVSPLALSCSQNNCFDARRWRRGLSAPSHARSIVRMWLTGTLFASGGGGGGGRGGGGGYDFPALLQAVSWTELILDVEFDSALVIEDVAFQRRWLLTDSPEISHVYPSSSLAFCCVNDRLSLSSRVRARTDLVRRRVHVRFYEEREALSASFAMTRLRQRYRQRPDGSLGLEPSDWIFHSLTLYDWLIEMDRERLGAIVSRTDSSFVTQQIDAYGTRREATCSICMHAKACCMLVCAHAFCVPCASNLERSPETFESDSVFWHSRVCAICRETSHTGFVTSFPVERRVELACRMVRADVLRHGRKVAVYSEFDGVLHRMKTHLQREHGIASEFTAGPSSDPKVVSLLRVVDTQPRFCPSDRAYYLHAPNKNDSDSTLDTANVRSIREGTRRLTILCSKGTLEEEKLRRVLNGAEGAEGAKWWI